MLVDFHHLPVAFPMFFLIFYHLDEDWKEALALILKLFGQVFGDVDVGGCIVLIFLSNIIRLEIF